MPETKETSRNTLAWSQQRVAPVTDILLWLSCYAAMVDLLSRAYPQMVPEFMAYQGTIIKCCRDFEGIACAQYNRVYRPQVAQSKDLHWSRPQKEESSKEIDRGVHIPQSGKMGTHAGSTP